MIARFKVSSPTAGRPAAGRTAAARLASFVLAALTLLFAGALGSACHTYPDPGDCIGGVIVDGVCEGKCTPDKCIEQNTCVGNRCVLSCGSHGECLADGVQACAPAKEDDTGTDILVCLPSGAPAGIGATCLTADACGRWLACPDGGGCLADQCGNDPEACALDEAACDGASGCTAGKCPDGGACRVGCASDCTGWLECESVGEGDPNAYCTNRDCAADGDCIDGFYCGLVRAPHDLCGATCAGPAGSQKCAGGNHDGEPCKDDKFCQKGNDELCGVTTEACKSPGQDGTTLFEGSQCLLRKSCLRRGPGATCTSDLDCSRIPGQKCAALGGERRCTHACASDFECQKDSACSAAEGACLPRFGKWIGAGQFCEPCFTDEDCGKNGTAVACAPIPGGGGACFDYAYPVECLTDADCPLSPGGLRGTCQDEVEGFEPDESGYHRCFLPVDPETEKTSCW